LFRCSSAGIDVHVGDQNDNSPKMDEKVLHADVRENTPVGSELMRIFASDNDDQNGFGKITFSVEEENGAFGIDSQTGQLILVKELDYEEKSSHTVRI